MPVATASLDAILDRLADFESDSAPVLSLYLDLQPEQPAQDYKTFLDTAAKEHEELQKDFEKVTGYLETEKPSARAVAFFACSGDEGLFEAIPLDASVEGHRLYIDREPHVFPLERLADQYASYAALLVNTNAARLFVFSAGAAERHIT